MCEERRNCIYSFCSRKPKYSVLAHACLPSVARCKAELPPSLDKSVKPLDPAPSSYTHAAKLQVSHGSETCNIYCCWWCCFSVQSVKRGYAGPHKSGFLIAWGWGSMLQTSEHITNFWAYHKEGNCLLLQGWCWGIISHELLVVILFEAVLWTILRGIKNLAIGEPRSESVCAHYEW